MTPAPNSREPSPILSVASLLLSVAFLIMGNGLQLMLLPIRGGLEGFSTVQVGLMGSGYYFGFVLGCLFTPMLIKRAGHIRTFAALAAIASAVAIGYPMLVNALVWAALRLLTGFCLAGLYLIVESWLNGKATKGTRGALISTYVAINYTVITIGQMIVTLFDPSSFVLFSIASILVSVAAVPLALSRSAEPEAPKLVRFRPIRLLRLSPAGTVSVFLNGLATGTFWSLGPIFADGKSGSVTSAALFMSVAVLGGAVAQWPVGRLSDAMDRRHVLIGISALAAVVCAIMVVLPDLGGPWLIFALLFGASFLPTYAVASAHVFDFAERADFVEVSAGLLLLYGLGSSIGPILASSAMQAFGAAAFPVFIALMQLLLIGFVVQRLTRRKGLAESDKAAFDLGTTAPVITVGGSAEVAEPTAL